MARLTLPAAKLILRELEYGPANIHKLISVIRLAENTTRAYLRELRGANKIHICRYERLPNGFRPVYALGEGKNARLPKPITKAEMQSRFRKKAKLKKETILRGSSMLAQWPVKINLE